jgi:hypothetical protein
MTANGVQEAPGCWCLPVVYSVREAEAEGRGWHRAGVEDVCYYRNQGCRQEQAEK